MKGFLEEYGVIIVVVIVVLAFVAFAAIFNTQITDAVKGILGTFFTKSGASAA